MTRAKDISKIVSDANFGGTLDVTGTSTLSGLTYPTSDGSANQFITTDGSGALSFATVDFTALNASNLTSGTVPDARITGAYTGITNLTATGVGTFGSLDISGDIDVDGVTNLDVVDIDGAVDMASTLTVGGAFTSLGIDDNADATAMTIDSSEYVMIGTTDNSPENNSAGTTDDNGIALSPYGYGSFARYASNSGTGIPLFVNRTNADGSLVEFRKDGAVVGTIGNAGARLFINSGTVGLNFAGDGSDQILPSNAGANRDNAITLGATNVRFKDLYLSGGAFLGGTGTANQLDDYEEGTWTPAYSGGGSAPTVAYSQQVGSYLKIGKFVFLSFSLNTSSVSGGSSSSDLSVSGIPFACGSQTGDRGALSTVRTQNFVTNARSPVAGYINEGSSLILLSSYDAGAYSTATLCDTDDLRTTGDSNQLTATVTYISA